GSEPPNPSFRDAHPRLSYLMSVANLTGTPATDPYVFLADGSPFVMEGDRPRPLLSDTPGYPISGGSLSQLLAVTNDVWVGAVFVNRYTKHSSFLFALVENGAFRSLDLDGDTPYVDGHLRIYADQRHARIVFKSKTRVHVFDSAGRTLARVGLDDPARKSLQAFHLLGVSPAGEILLFHRKHRTLLLVDATPDVGSLPDA